MTLQIVMPMGGLGQRFRAIGVRTPKPLIDVAGVPMFLRALNSFDVWHGRTTLTVVIRREDDERDGLAARIREARADANVVIIESLTRGAAETALAARDMLDPHQPLVVMDCDIAFESPEYFEMIRTREDLDGVLLSFRSRDPRYSFADVGDDGLVRRTAEKLAISSHALMGAYYFRTAEVFLSAASAQVELGLIDAQELYLSATYNSIIQHGGRVGVAHGLFYCFGTPEELEEYLSTGRPVGDA